MRFAHRPARRYPRVALAAALAAAIGCDDPADSPVQSSADPRRNVLVIDDGFDLSLPIFAGKVAGRYTVVCRNPDPPPPPPPPSPDAGADALTAAVSELEQAKVAYLDQLRSRDESCAIEEGIADARDTLVSLARYRRRWNNTISKGGSPRAAFSATEWSEIDRVFKEQLPAAEFHGTATSGVVAFDNPTARLVLVQIPLSTVDQLQSAFQCIKQVDIDRTVALWSDPDVRLAARDGPRSRFEDDLAALIGRHRIGLANLSFGGLPRAALDDLQERRGCQPVDLRRYYELTSEFQNLQQAGHPLPDYLSVKSAGNEGAQLDGPADGECFQGNASTVMVGSDDVKGRISEFSNFGRCVDLFAPGEDIISYLPGGWLLPLSGTSFSSPLVARFVSRGVQGAFSPAGARLDLLARRDPAGHLPLESFPRALLYANLSSVQALSAQALSIDGPVLRIPRPATRISAIALLRFLRPLFRMAR